MGAERRILERVANAVEGALVRTFDRPLEPPSAADSERCARLRAAMAALPVESVAGKPESQAVWLSRMNALRERVMSDDPRAFLRWRELRSMFTTTTGYLRREFLDLRRRPDWRTRWRTAIRESPAGHPPPFPYYPRSSGNLIHHAYHLMVFEKSAGIRIGDIRSIFEFGAGYGSLCRLCRNLGFGGTYVLFDLPHFSLLQRYFLESVRHPVVDGESCGPAPDGVALCLSDAGRLDAALSAHTQPRRLFVATWSVSEAPRELRDRILRAVAGFDAFLIAYQERFREIDNVAYFREWRESLAASVRWQEWVMPYLPGHHYLIGRRVHP